MDELECRKEQIYKALIGKTMNVRQLSKIVNIKENRLVNNLRWMAERKYLISERIYDNSARRFVVLYTASTLVKFVPVLKEPKHERLYREKQEKIAKKKRIEELNAPKSLTRVVNLLDNPLPSAPRSKKGSAFKGIGSSFSMYDYY